MKLGAVTSAACRSRATVHDQTIHVPLGGILGAGQSATVTRRLLGDAAQLDHRLELAVHADATASSTPTAGSRGSAGDVPFDRPNHGDPFVTPVEPAACRSRSRPTGRWSIATTGEPVATERPDDDVRGDATSATSRSPRRPTIARRRRRSATSRSASTTGRVPGVGRACRTRSHAIRAYAAAASGRTRTATYDLAQTAGGYGMESPGLTWIPTGAGEPDLPRPPRDRPPVVLRDRRARPGVRAVHRRGR